MSKPVYPKMLSQLTKRSSAGFLKRNSAFQVATVRYQSNKTASSDEKAKAEVAAKVAKQKQSDKYNAMSNQNLIAQHPKAPAKPTAEAKKSKKVKVNYSAIPKVPSTKFFTYQEIAFDHLMNGHRPLLVFHRKNEQLSALEDFFKAPSVWSQSATGTQKLEDSWDQVPYETTQDLKPFTPPPSPKEKEQLKVKETEEHLEGFINSLDSKTGSKNSSKSSSTISKRKTRGRYRPSYDFDFNNQDF